jgi:hypothetical protein
MIVSCPAHVKGRRHKKRVASRRKAEHDLLSTLTVHKQRLLDEQVTGARANDSSCRSDDTSIVDSSADGSSTLNIHADLTNNS